MPTEPTILEILSLSDPISVLELVFYLLLVALVILGAYLHGDGPPPR